MLDPFCNATYRMNIESCPALHQERKAPTYWLKTPVNWAYTNTPTHGCVFTSNDSDTNKHVFSYTHTHTQTNKQTQTRARTQTHTNTRTKNILRIGFVWKDTLLCKPHLRRQLSFTWPSVIHCAPFQIDSFRLPSLKYIYTYIYIYLYV